MVRSGWCGKVWNQLPHPKRWVSNGSDFSALDGNVLSTLAVMGSKILAVVFWQHAKRSAKHESRNCSIRFAMTNPSDGYEWSITHFGDFFGALLQIVR